MLNAPRLTLLVVTAFLGAGVSATSLGAQIGVQKGVQKGAMVDENVNIRMPFILRNFSPAIDQVKAVCHVFQSNGLEVSSKESLPLKTTPKNADGSLSGTLVTVHEFKRSASETGMLGHYRCALEGVTSSGTRVEFGGSYGKNAVGESIKW